MIDERRKQEAKRNFDTYIRDGLLKKERNEQAKEKYMENAELSLRIAHDLMDNKNNPYLWVIVTSYYAMFYMANAVLLHLGYKTREKIVHKVTSDAIIVLVLERMKQELFEDYEMIREDALEIASAKAEDIIGSYDSEREKRSTFQYNMLEEMKEKRAKTSLARAREFLFEMKKLMK